METPEDRRRATFTQPLVEQGMHLDQLLADAFGFDPTTAAESAASYDTR